MDLITSSAGYSPSCCSSDRWKELNKTNEGLDTRLQSVRQKISTVRDQRRVGRYRHGEEQDALKTKLHKLRGRWIKQHKNYKLALYAGAVQDAMKDSALHIPAKVQNEQAMLCRYLHLMEIHERELHQMQSENVNLVRFMKKQIKKLGEAKTHVELDWMNKLCVAEADVKTLKQKLDESTPNQSTTTVTTSSLLDDDDDDAYSQQDDPELQEALAGIEKDSLTTDIGRVASDWIKSVFAFSPSTSPFSSTSVQSKSSKMSRPRSHSTDGSVASTYSRSSNTTTTTTTIPLPPKLKRIVTPPPPKPPPAYNRKSSLTYLD